MNGGKKRMKKMNILIISYYYPPLQSIATNRIYSFAKYLNKEKYNITVLTVDNGIAIDDSQLLEHVEVIRVKEKSLLQKAKFEKPTNLFGIILRHYIIKFYRAY
jgi:hypothetical protein